MKFIITTDDPRIEKAIMNMLVSFEVFGADSFEFETKGSKSPEGDRKASGGGGQARTHYVPVLPENPTERIETIKQNLEAVGAKTITGLMYQRIVALHADGKKVTEPELRKAMDLKGGTSQRSIGTLCRNGIVNAVPIIKGTE